MHVYFIRHAQSQNNALHPDEYHLRSEDPPLTDLGKKQAQHLATYIHDVRSASYWDSYDFTHIYCSPMHRTMETAQPLAQKLGIRPQVWVDLHEVGGVFKEEGEKNFVGYPGMPRAAIQASFIEYDLPDEISDVGWYDPTSGVEDLMTAQLRAMRVAETLHERAGSDDCVAIISHFAFLDLLIKAIFRALPTYRGQFQYYHNNTARTRIQFQKDKQPALIYLNRTNHLPFDMQSY